MLLRNRLDQAESIKSGISEISSSSEPSQTSLVAKTTLRRNFCCLDLSREETGGQGIVDDNIQPISLTTRNELVFKRPS